MLKDCKIIKQLGFGMNGMVYKIKYMDDKYYALKIGNIYDLNHYKENLKREIDFNENVAKIYPEQFVQLYNNETIKNFNINQKYTIDIKTFPENVQNIFKKKEKSNMCYAKLYSLMDCDLFSVIDKLNENQTYSVIIQLCYITYLMHKLNYVHGDLYCKNIGVEYVNEYITIFNKKIFTFGYKLKVFDYDFILHKKYDLKYDMYERDEIKKYNYLMNNEFRHLIFDFICGNQTFWKNAQNYNKDDFTNEYKKSSFYKKFKNVTNNIDDQIRLFEILHPDDYQYMILKNKYEYTVYPKIRININDVYYIITHMPENYQQIINIIDYFENKLHENDNPELYYCNIFIIAMLILCLSIIIYIFM